MSDPAAPGASKADWLDRPDLLLVLRPLPDGAPQIIDQYTEEAQLQGKSFGGKLSWILGGYQDNPTPPFFITRYVTLGAARGVEAELHVWEAMPHAGFGGGTPEDEELEAQVLKFLDKHLA